MVYMKWKMAEANIGYSVKQFLREVGQFSKRILIKAKSDQGKILVNGEHQTVRYILQKGDILEVYLPEEKPSNNIEKEPLPIDILYEDEWLLILNKAAGMATIPSRKHTKGTLANGILYHYDRIGLQATIHVVTRLDKDTSGLVLVAKNRYVHSLLAEDQKNKAIDRTYLAIIQGHLEERVGTINQPIGRKASSIIERAVMTDGSGRAAITHYEVLEEYPDDSFVRIQLETGRTHQIRVHFAYLGTPLIGDSLYGIARGKIKRQALHCSHLTFYHPITGQHLTISAPIPNDMENLIMMK